MEINGVTTIRMGDVIDFLVPVTGTVHTETFDKYYSGKFLITKARHEFSSLGKNGEVV